VGQSEDGPAENSIKPSVCSFLLDRIRELDDVSGVILTKIVLLKALLGLGFGLIILALL